MMIPRLSFRTAILARPVRGFASSTRIASAVKPGSDSEATVPGGGGTEDIANSSGAYDGANPDPTSAAKKIEKEGQAEFSSSSTASAVDEESSRAATQKKHASEARPTKQEQKKPSRTDLGGRAARKGRE